MNEKNKIRLIYAQVKEKEYCSSKEQLYNTDIYSSCSYKIPKQINLPQSLKIISFLFDNAISNVENGKKFSIDEIKKIEAQLSYMGFEKSVFSGSIRTQGCGDIKFATTIGKDIFSDVGVSEIIIYSGNSLLFEKSDLKNRYRNWYTPNVTQQQVDDILNETDDIENE